MRTCLALMLTAALAVPALAQQPGRRGGGMGRGGVAFLITNKSVQEELKMTEDQLEKVKEFQAKQKEAFSKLQDLSQEERKEKMAELMKENTENANKFVKDALKPEQSKRLKQIEYQTAGVNSADAQKELKLSDDQKGKIKEIADKTGQEVRDMMQGGGFGDPETQKKIAALRKESAEKAVGVLDADQKKQWGEMTGKAFEIKFDAFGPGGDTPKKKKKKDKE